MKTLLFVTPCLSFAGAEKILCWVAEEFAKKNYDVHILNLNLLDNNSRYAVETLKNVEIHNIKRNYMKGLNNYYRVLAMVKLAREIKASCFISFTRYPCVLSVIAGKIAGIPTIISERGDPYQYQHGFKNYVDFLILNSAAGCVFQTEYAKKVYGKRHIKTSEVIPNPVFKTDEKRWNKNAGKTIISVGRLDNTQKRYDVMIESFEQFHERHSDYELHIYGKGPDEDKIVSSVEEKGLTECVKFKGLTKNPTPLLCAAQIFLITSDFEGVPNALLEAMAVGMPVVSTDCSPGGARFLIENHCNGLIVPTGDIVAISSALSEYAEDESLRIKCGDNAFDVCRRFEPGKIFQQWEQYVEKVLE